MVEERLSIYFNLGLIYIASKRFPEALKFFEKYCQQTSTNSTPDQPFPTKVIEALQHLSLAQDLTGNYEGADSTLQ